MHPILALIFTRLIENTTMIDMNLILENVRNYEGYSNGQFNQDIYALAVNNFKTHGYFVEFGAMTGVEHSNTYVLERQYNWTGIVVECGRGFQEVLKKSRLCKVDFRAVYKNSNEILAFKEMQGSFTGLSGLEDFNYQDMHSSIRQNQPSSTYYVTTVSLNDLLLHHEAPYDIDYMSVDTEGSEPVILEAFDFSKHRIKFFTIEHNHNIINKEKVRNIMFKNGYSLIFEELSGIDDYFILQDN